MSDEKLPEGPQTAPEEETPGLLKFTALFIGIPFILIIVFMLVTH